MTITDKGCERKDCHWWCNSDSWLNRGINSHNCSKPLRREYMGDDCPWICSTEVERDHVNCKEFEESWWSQRPWKK